jgi:uncharacterized protein YbjT (DUF2867 family)
MIVVIGGTGSLDGKVAELLRADGHDVRIMTRSHFQATVLHSAGTDAVTADLRHPGSLPAAPRCAARTPSSAPRTEVTRPTPTAPVRWTAPGSPTSSPALVSNTGPGHGGEVGQRCAV